MTDFDPTAPLPGPPDPWAEGPTPSPASGPPFHMTDMIAAEPAVADRILARLAAGAATGRATRRRDPLDHRSRRPGRRDRLRHVRARRTRRRRDPPRGGRRGRLRLRRASARSRPSSCRSRPAGRGLVIGVTHEGGDRRDERGPRSRARRRRADRGHHRQSPVAGRVARLDRRRDRRAGPGLVSHGRLRRARSLAAAAVGGAPVRAGRLDRARRRAPRSPRRAATRPAAEAIGRASRRRRPPPRHRLGRRPDRRPRARPQGRGGVLAARRRTATSRPSCTATSPATGRRDRARPHPDRPRPAAGRVARARQALAAARVIGTPRRGHPRRRGRRRDRRRR